jgi:hypothetical protein
MELNVSERRQRFLYCFQIGRHGHSVGAPSSHRNYLRTCAMTGIEPVSRERALRLMQEWIEMLSGRPDPRKH